MPAPPPPPAAPAAPPGRRGLALVRAARGLLAAAAAALALAAGPAAALDPDKAFNHYVRDAWSLEQGLPQISVHAIAQDRRGYLWAGTQAGLARFDGVRFVPYTSETTEGFAGQWIRALLADPDGRLWIGSYRGLAVHQDGRFRTLPAGPGHADPLPDILALARGADGTIYATTAAGVSRVEGDALALWRPMDQPVAALLADDEGLWVGGVGRVLRLGPDGAEAEERLPDDAADAVVHRLAVHDRQRWAGTSAGLFVRGDDGTWRRWDGDAELAQTPIEALYTDRDGHLWVATVEHLARLRRGQLREWVRERPSGLSVRAIAEDREGNLWLGSVWLGLTRLRDGWTRRYSSPEGLHDPLLWSLARGHDGRLWAGTNAGLARFDGERFEVVVDGADLPHPNAYTLLAEGERLWIGTRGGLVLREADGRVHEPEGFEALRGAQVSGLLRARDGRLWVASSRGVGVEDRPGAGLRLLASADGGPGPFARVLAEAPDGRVLVGSRSGLQVVDGERLRPVGLDAGLDAGMDVTALHLRPDGRIVAGTLDERLAIERPDGSWRVAGPADGLPPNGAFFITEYRDALWVAGLRGIYRLPVAELDGGGPLRGQMLLNERGDRGGGQKGFCCNGAGNAKGFLEDGTLWLPTRDGVVTLDTQDIRTNPMPPPVVVERVRANGAWRDVQAGGSLALPADARDLDLEFTALSYQAPANVDLRVRLRGYDTDWRALEDPTRRDARYTNLPPGDYVFEVTGANNDGVWALEPARLAFSIAPAFHETWAARGLLVLATVLALGALYRLKLRRLRRQGEALERLVGQRTEALEDANRRLSEASLTDPLTGLRNRRYLGAQIPADLAFYDREPELGAEGGGVLVLAIIDIDHFKRVNDTHGHHAGDLVLQQFARVLEQQVRTGDYIARWGGEEFVLVFRPLPGRHVPMLGERLRSAIAGHAFDIGAGAPLRITCSIGFVAYPLFDRLRGLPGWELMLSLADRALYHVKANGRDGWAQYVARHGLDGAAASAALSADPGLRPEDAGLVLIGPRAVPRPDPGAQNE